jgi:hypothetical protein
MPVAGNIGLPGGARNVRRARRFVRPRVIRAAPPPRPRVVRAPPLRAPAARAAQPTPEPRRPAPRVVRAAPRPRPIAPPKVVTHRRAVTPAPRPEVRQAHAVRGQQAPRRRAVAQQRQALRKLLTPAPVGIIAPREGGNLPPEVTHPTPPRPAPKPKIPELGRPGANMLARQRHAARATQQIPRDFALRNIVKLERGGEPLARQEQRVKNLRRYGVLPGQPDYLRRMDRQIARKQAQEARDAAKPKPEHGLTKIVHGVERAAVHNVISHSPLGTPLKAIKTTAPLVEKAERFREKARREHKAGTATPAGAGLAALGIASFGTHLGGGVTRFVAKHGGQVAGLPAEIPLLATSKIADITGHKATGKFLRGAAAVPGNITGDIGDIATNFIPSQYHLGTQIARGQYKQAAKEQSQFYKELYHHPGRTLYKHPVTTYLATVGLLEGVSRGAGGIARAVHEVAPEGSRASRVGRALGATERSSRTHPGTGFEVRRQYHPGAGPVRLVQKLRDRREGATHIRQQKVRAQRPRKGLAGMATRAVGRAREMARPGDVEAAVDQSMRLARGVETQDLRRADALAQEITRPVTVPGTRTVTKPRGEKSVVGEAHTLHTQGAVAPNKADLERYLAQIVSERDKPSEFGNPMGEDIKAVSQALESRVREAITALDENRPEHAAAVIAHLQDVRARLASAIAEQTPMLKGLGVLDPAAGDRTQYLLEAMRLGLHTPGAKATAQEALGREAAAATRELRGARAERTAATAARRTTKAEVALSEQLGKRGAKEYIGPVGEAAKEMRGTSKAVAQHKTDVAREHRDAEAELHKAVVAAERESGKPSTEYRRLVNLRKSLTTELRGVAGRAVGRARGAGKKAGVAQERARVVDVAHARKGRDLQKTADTRAAELASADRALTALRQRQASARRPGDNPAQGVHISGLSARQAADPNLRAAARTAHQQVYGDYRGAPGAEDLRSTIENGDRPDQTIGDWFREHPMELAHDGGTWFSFRVPKRDGGSELVDVSARPGEADPVRRGGTVPGRSQKSGGGAGDMARHLEEEHTAAGAGGAAAAEPTVGPHVPVIVRDLASKPALEALVARINSATAEQLGRIRSDVEKLKLRSDAVRSGGLEGNRRAILQHIRNQDPRLAMATRGVRTRGTITDRHIGAAERRVERLRERADAADQRVADHALTAPGGTEPAGPITAAAKADLEAQRHADAMASAHGHLQALERNIQREFADRRLPEDVAHRLAVAIQRVQAARQARRAGVPAELRDAAVAAERTFKEVRNRYNLDPARAEKFWRAMARESDARRALVDARLRVDEVKRRAQAVREAPYVNAEGKPSTIQDVQRTLARENASPQRAALMDEADRMAQAIASFPSHDEVPQSLWDAMSENARRQQEMAQAEGVKAAGFAAPSYMPHVGEVIPGHRHIPVDRVTVPFEQERAGVAFERGLLEGGGIPLLHHTLTRNARLITRARMRHDLIDEMVLRRGDNSPVIFPPGAKRAAEDYAQSITGQIFNGQKTRWTVMTDQLTGGHAIVPEALRNRLQLHESRAEPSALDRVGRIWRGAVLAFSARWLFGQYAEGSLRTLIQHGMNPFDIPASYRFAANTFRELQRTDPEGAVRLQAIWERGGLSRGHEANDELYYQQFKQQLAAQDTLKAWERWRANPNSGNLGGLVRAWQHFVFEHANGAFEAHARQAQVGKILRQMAGQRSQLSGQTLGGVIPGGQAFEMSMGRAVTDWADGRLDTASQRHVLKELDKAWGQYQGRDPRIQRFIENFTPFIPWWLNAMRFIFHVMPADHPVLSALAASTNQASEEWRKRYGLIFEPFTADPTERNRLPRYMQGSVYIAGGYRNLTHYTPFGGFQDTLDEPGSLFMPQVRDLMHASEGRDAFGRKLEGWGTTSGPFGKVGPLRTWGAMAAALLGMFMPNLAKGLNAVGVTMPNQNKPKTSRATDERIKRLINPFTSTPIPPGFTLTPGQAPSTGGGGGGAAPPGGEVFVPPEANTTGGGEIFVPPPGG